jgi:hypothetical protein
MEFKLWLSEMPIGIWKQIPDDPDKWKPDAKKKWGWPARDAALVSNPAAVQKIRNMFENTEFLFDFYFIRSKEAKKYGISGNWQSEVDAEWIKENLKVNIQANPEAITVIYAGNQQETLTGWMMAHRMGHAFARTSSRKSLYQWEEFVRRLRQSMVWLIDYVYEYEIQKGAFGFGPTDYSGNEEPKLRRLAKDIGTMKSSKSGKLQRFDEFAYELLAQYLLSKNKIKFNNPAQQLITKYAWGKASSYLSNKIGDKDFEKLDLQHTMEGLADEYGDLIHSVLTQATGKIFMV